MLSVTGFVIIIIFCALLIGIFLLTFIKGTTHFNYLKEIHPNELGGYNSIFDLQNFNPFSDRNNYLFLLLFPTFERYQTVDDNPHLKKFEKRIKNLCISIYVLIFSLVSFVAVLIIFFGDFT